MIDFGAVSGLVESIVDGMMKDETKEKQEKRERDKLPNDTTEIIFEATDSQFNDSNDEESGLLVDCFICFSV